MPIACYLGFDPGGRTGVALLTVGDDIARCVTDSVDSVDAAFQWACGQLGNQTPRAAGLDTFLFWETGPSGWRHADLWLKARYQDVSNSVLSSNSTFGAMAVQGMALAILVKRRWPQIELIETHPKVLYRALAGQKYQWPGEMRAWLAQQINCPSANFANDHCWDAALSAWAAFKGHTRSWNRNLHALSDTPIEPAGSCAYWWPE